MTATKMQRVSRFDDPRVPNEMPRGVVPRQDARQVRTGELLREWNETNRTIAVLHARLDARRARRRDGDPAAALAAMEASAKQLITQAASLRANKGAPEEVITAIEGAAKNVLTQIATARTEMHVASAQEAAATGHDAAGSGEDMVPDEVLDGRGETRARPNFARDGISLEQARREFHAALARR